jgi:hypothetical protein
MVSHDTVFDCPEEVFSGGAEEKPRINLDGWKIRPKLPSSTNKAKFILVGNGSETRNVPSLT